MKHTHQFNLKAIDQSLGQFQKEFNAINDTLAIRREVFTDPLRQNILLAYEYLNGLLEKGIELFTPAGLHCMLELNHIVLCGTDPATRYEFNNHILETRAGYQEKIRPIRKWVMNRKALPAVNLAAGFYVRALSRPQLFIEGNHRTENIILNYILLSRDEAPYIIHSTTARDYLDISGSIKFSDRGSMFETWKINGSLHRKLCDFLNGNLNAQYLTRIKEG